MQLRREGTTLSPVSFHSSFAAASFASVLSCSESSRNMGFRNALLRIRVFNVVIASLKLMIED